MTMKSHDFMNIYKIKGRSTQITYPTNCLLRPCSVACADRGFFVGVMSVSLSFCLSITPSTAALGDYRSLAMSISDAAQSGV